MKKYKVEAEKVTTMVSTVIDVVKVFQYWKTTSINISY